MKTKIISALLVLTTFATLHSLQKGKSYTSKIQKVKLYQNRALITRTSKVQIRKGTNKIILSQLPAGLLNWSVRGSLPSNLNAKIMSIEVEKKALLKERNKKIVQFEKKINDLKESDREEIDQLDNLKLQEDFIKSLLNFAVKTNIKDNIQTRTPKVKTWDKTLRYIANKRKNLFILRRKIERRRKSIGKQLQKLQYDLYQISGYSYFNNYQNISRSMLKNRSIMQQQSYQSSNQLFNRRENLLASNNGLTNSEKQINIEIFSNENKSIKLKFQYQISNSSWQMKYDFRASMKRKKVFVNVFGQIYQNTGESWEDVNLILSTAKPQSSIQIPYLPKWKIYTGNYGKQNFSSKSFTQSVNDEDDDFNNSKISSGYKDKDYKTKVNYTGISFNINLPVIQSIPSSKKKQKKFIKEYQLKNQKSVEFYYELLPAVSKQAYIKAKLTNSTDLPWLPGTAQLFLENEFMGKAKIPYTPVGKIQVLLLGTDKRVTARKTLEKKSQDKSGIFNGNNKTTYQYKLQVENNSNKTRKIVLIDNLPYPLAKTVDIELESLSTPFSIDPQNEDPHQKEKLSQLSYNQGIRKWIFKLTPNSKKIIRYKISVTIDKNLRTSGLK